ncbi:MAG TPA: type II toxin-antitoxin system HicB family antitoxin [Alphaproteobacteria bacterium]|jgi:predicted RNase H-like HicB family nuclease|nr:type II toxin-antitoxin system HicB family antitoxin [Alphaproteobacteria bacterium]
MSKKDLKAIVWKEGNWYVAKAFGIEVASQGLTRKEAIENLQEAVDLLLEDEEVRISQFLIPDNPQITAIYA